jgi:mono/diheme cytochrome c family protein
MLSKVAVVGVLACLTPMVLNSRQVNGNTQSSRPDTADTQLFHTYCASCHGVTGHGDGPIAGEFRKVPPDLTKYSARNGGVFPSERLRQIIDGRGVPAHGNREMPVWGDAFRSGRGALSAEGVTARIDAIVRYLKAIQERSAE